MMDNATLEAEVQAIMRRPYAKIIRGEPVEGFLASVPELPGCFTAGETEEDALAMLQEAMAAWLEATLAHGDPVPPPVDDTAGTADLYVRLPYALYKRLSDRACADGQNIVDLAAAILADALAVSRT